MLPNEAPEICRLCLVKEHVNINIFEDNTEQLFYKITSYLPISISVDDELPKKICSNCCNKVNLLYEFWNQTLHAQKYLLTWLNDENKFELCHKNADRKSANHLEKSEKNCRNFKSESYGEKNEDFSNTSSPDFWCSNKDESDERDGNSCFHDEDDVAFDGISNQAQSVASEDPESSALKRLQGIDPLEDPLAMPDTSTESPKTNESLYENQLHSEISTKNRHKVLPTNTKDTATATRKEHHPKKTTTVPPALQIVSPANKNDGVDAAKPFSCAQCTQSFQTAALRTKHEKAAHKGAEIKYSCDKCSFTTFTKGCLTTHVRRRHQHNYFCEDCSLGFFTKGELTAHNIKEHDVQPFQCAICNELFVSKSNLYTHIKNHDASNLYVCEVCGRTYKKKNSYKRHITRSHLGLSTEAQCDICKRVLSSKDHLRRHMLTHTDERNWVCATCGKCFLSKTYLTEHSRIHLGIRPYKCEICGKSFTQRGSLTIHKRSHTGERPYRCECCHKGFVMSTLLRYHLRKCTMAKAVAATATAVASEAESAVGSSSSSSLPGSTPVATESNPFLCSGPIITEGASVKIDAEAFIPNFVGLGPFQSSGAGAASAQTQPTPVALPSSAAPARQQEQISVITSSESRTSADGVEDAS